MAGVVDLKVGTTNWHGKLGVWRKIDIPDCVDGCIQEDTIGKCCGSVKGIRNVEANHICAFAS
jgi:hypothetical protein